ncbi:P-loop NTPase fold protein [Brevibacillus sp. Leaf182]|uniref:KAP family P-loop NTPase fold protein n=1 Tax=Brevibacillus sp. Leaf182 TaxID=1736290 RepID=UPI0006F6428E|nr:P-loop NTPase fold protein [Brevibacillus sp. Leaf182]RAT95681.1 hypothetical protein ASG16_023065 [Brevibacillus sp. Leaf182]
MSYLTFENDDKLNRKTFAIQLTKVLSESKEYVNEGSLVVALNSPWGTGKSTFINMWKSYISDEFKESFDTFYYNAWSFDNWDNALTPIVNTLITQYKFTGIKTKLKTNLMEKALGISKHLTVSTVKKWSGVDLNEIADILGTSEAEVIDSLKTDSNYDPFKELEEYEKIKDEFKSVLTEISKEKKIVLFIDELDRCKPLYAIETLEAVKHFFDIDNIIFVLSLDMEQLSHSISTVYGNNMDSQGYLRRFFNLNFNIPSPTVEEYTEFIFEQKGIIIESNLCSFSVKLFKSLKLSLRDINTVSTNIKLLFNTIFESDTDIKMLEIYFYLITLKYKKPEIYKTILTNRYLTSENRSTGNYDTLETYYYRSNEFNDNILRFVRILENDGSQRTLLSLIQDNKTQQELISNERTYTAKEYQDIFKRFDIYFVDGKDIFINKNLLQTSISQYLDRKLELFYSWET